MRIRECIVLGFLVLLSKQTCGQKEPLNRHLRKFEFPSPAEMCTNIHWYGFTAGTILSHPDNLATYLENLDCDVHVTAGGHPFMRVNITITRFKLQSPVDGKCMDFLRFYADDQMTEPLTDELCGELSDIPEEFRQFTVFGEKFILHFFTDDYRHETGFSLTYVSYKHFNGTDLSYLEPQPGPVENGGSGSDDNGSASHDGSPVLLVVMLWLGLFPMAAMTEPC